MPRAPFGVVITDPFTNRDRLIAYLNLAKPRAVVVVGSAELSRSLCDLFPDMVVVARRYGAEDDNRHRVNESGAAWVRSMRDWLSGDRRPLLYWNNEPTYAGIGDPDDDYERLADDKALIKRAVEVYKAARDEGYTVIGPNWAVGWPLQPANFTPIYEASVKYGHLIGLHIYGGRSLTDDSTLDWFISKADEIAGLCSGVQIAFDEFGLDVIGQIPNSGPYRRIGISGRDFGLMHVGSWEILRYRPYVKWATTFCWGALDTKWRDYDVRDDLDFQAVMIATPWADSESEPTPQPEPTPEPEPAPTPPATMRLAHLASTSAGGTLVRSGPGKSWAKVGGIPAAGVNGAYDPDYLTADGYQWIEVWTPTVQGWAARQFLDIEGGAAIPGHRRRRQRRDRTASAVGGGDGGTRRAQGVAGEGERGGRGMRRYWSYLKYVLRHKWFVFREGLKIGVPLWQLLIHDWSKFLPGEWFPYAQTFYKSDGSHQYAPDGTGFDDAWNHHQKCQPHHWQYWLLNWDQPHGKWNVQEVQPGTGFILAYNGQPTHFTCPEISVEDGGAAYQADYQLLRGVVNQLNNAPMPLPMPDRYRREMLADWRGAGLALGKPDTRGWYLANRDNIQLHPETRVWIEEQLNV